MTVRELKTNKADIDYSGEYVIVWDKNGDVILK